MATLCNRLARTVYKGCTYNTRCVDYSRVPVLDEHDLEENYVRGSGPGGQAVNKTSNCVILKHKPTGLVIKCHQTRSLHENRRIARQLLLTKLDNLLNGEDSVESQMRAADLRKQAEKQRRKRRLQELKEDWKKREGMA